MAKSDQIVGICSKIQIVSSVSLRLSQLSLSQLAHSIISLLGLDLARSNRILIKLYMPYQKCHSQMLSLLKLAFLPR